MPTPPGSTQYKLEVMATDPKSVSPFAATKLEENPLLPLDTQANLVYTLTRLFRVLAQVVNPLVEWASGWAIKWARIVPNNTADATTLNVNGPSPGGEAALSLNAAPTDGGAQIYGRRDGKTLWYVFMPYSDDNFYIGRHNPAGTFADNPVMIRWNSGEVRIAKLLTAGGDYSGSLGIDKPNGTESQIKFSRAGVQQWYIAHNTANDWALARADTNTGAYVSTAINVSFNSGTTRLQAIGQEKTTLILQDSQSGASQGANLQFTNNQWGSRWMRLNASGWLTFINAAYNSETHAFSNDGRMSCTADFSAGSSMSTANWYNVRGWAGLAIASSNGDGSSYTYCEIAQANPAWNLTHFRAWHQHGQWAGWQFYADNTGNTIQFVMSNAGGWGTIRAASFEVQSDERAKQDVAVLPQQHDAFMGIKPISWKWPEAPAPKDGGPPVYADTRDKWGFSAQNLAIHVPLAVNGSVVAEDADGKPLSASVDPVPITALTVLEVQALWQRIATLEDRLAAIEH